MSEEKTYIEQFYEKIQSGVIIVSQKFKDTLNFWLEEIKTGRKSLDIKKRNELIKGIEEWLGYKLLLFDKVFLEIRILTQKEGIKYE